MTARTSPKIGRSTSDMSGTVTASPQSCTRMPTSPTSPASPVIMKRSIALGGGSSPVSCMRWENSDVRWPRMRRATATMICCLLSKCP